MLINVVKPPLSPVQSAALSPTEKRTQKTPTENAIEPHQLNVQPEYSRSLGYLYHGNTADQPQRGMGAIIGKSFGNPYQLGSRK